MVPLAGDRADSIPQLAVAGRLEPREQTQRAAPGCRVDDHFRGAFPQRRPVRVARHGRGQDLRERHPGLPLCHGDRLERFGIPELDVIGVQLCDTALQRAVKAVDLHILCSG